MAFAAERQNFAPGEAIITEGKPAKSAYFILNGTALLQQLRQNLGQAEAGSMLGETAMLGSARYSLTATAEGPVSAVRIDRELFHRVASEYPEFGRAVVEALSEKLGVSMRELEGVRGLLNKARSFSGV